MKLADAAFHNIPIKAVRVCLPLDNKDSGSLYYTLPQASNYDELKKNPVHTELLNELGDKKNSIEFIELKREITFKVHNQAYTSNFEIKYFSRLNQDSDLIVFSIQPPSQPVSPELRKYWSTFTEQLPNFFTIKTKKTSIEHYLTEAQKEKINFYQKEISDLGQVSKSIIENLATQSKEWNQALLDTQRKLEEQSAANKEKLNNEYLEKEEKLKREVAEFEERKKQFDDRDRTVVRRDLLNKIKGAIDDQEEFELSKATRSKRHWVTAALGIGLLFSGIIVWNLLSNLLQSKDMPWQLYIFLGTSTLGFISTLIYALRWTTQWYYDHSEIEFANQKFKKDILRASWIVEMFFEWKEQKQQFDMPVEIYNAISKNLFNERSSSKQINHPIEDLLKITNKFSKVKLGKEGIEVENVPKDKG
jgi:gas vesicle protein